MQSIAKKRGSKTRLMLKRGGHGGQVADLRPAFQRARRERMPRA
jgi:hypothetical protein